MYADAQAAEERRRAQEKADAEFARKMLEGRGIVAR
jgi:hypothetical protein